MTERHPPEGAGRFIVFEGGEGSGKSTQIELLAESLRGVGARVKTVREPGGTPVGERIRSLVLDPAVDTPDRTELLLMLAARAALVDRVIVPAVREGTILLSDRFDLSTFAYQGVGRELGVDTIEPLNRFATAGICAHLTIVLDVPARETETRLNLRAEVPDRMEGERGAFHERVRAAYRSLARENERMELVSGDGGPREVHARVVAALADFWGETFPLAGVTEFQ